MSAVETQRRALPLELLRDRLARDTMVGFVLGGAFGVLIGLLATAIVGAVFLGGALAIVFGAIALLLSMTGRVVSWMIRSTRTRDGAR